MTEEGKYSLDAVQNNPEIEGSLRQGLNNASEKLDSIEAIREFYTLRTFNAGTGKNGYIKIADIKILDAHSNAPIMFEVSGRGWAMPVQLFVSFVNANSIDPALGGFKYMGQLGTDIALCKSGTSMWALYVKKAEGYDVICLHRYNYNYYYRQFDITFSNDFAESLPADAVHPTLYS